MDAGVRLGQPLNSLFIVARMGNEVLGTTTAIPCGPNRLMNLEKTAAKDADDRLIGDENRSLPSCSPQTKPMGKATRSSPRGLLRIPHHPNGHGGYEVRLRHSAFQSETKRSLKNRRMIDAVAVAIRVSVMPRDRAGAVQSALLTPDGRPQARAQSPRDQSDFRWHAKQNP